MSDLLKHIGGSHLPYISAVNVRGIPEVSLVCVCVCVFTTSPWLKTQQQDFVEAPSHRCQAGLPDLASPPSPCHTVSP